MVDAGRSGIEIQTARGLSITHGFQRRFSVELGVRRRKNSSVSWKLVPEAVVQSQKLEERQTGLPHSMD
jgi:hypothetical protein